MLLTDKIKKSTSAIKKYRGAIQSKQNAEAYESALVQLVKAIAGVKETVECATVMKDSGIISTALIDEATRDDLVSCIDECGNGVAEISITMDAVRLLKTKGDVIAGQLKTAWKDASPRYSDGAKGYLSMIGGLSDDPIKARDLATNITKTVADAPSIKNIKSLVADVAEAKRITENFSLTADIECFLKKVSSQQATVLDLTPEILSWLKDKNLTSKLRVRF